MVNDTRNKGTLLKADIARAGFTINGFAREIGCAPRTVRHWLDANEGRPVPAYAVKILELSIEVADLRKRLAEIAGIATRKE
jgi:hypothetical protein